VLAIVYEWSSVNILVEVKCAIWVVLQFRIECSYVFLSILLINSHFGSGSFLYIPEEVGDAKRLIIAILIPNLEVVSTRHVFY